jgi:hypothetical protein
MRVVGRHNLCCNDKNRNRKEEPETPQDIFLSLQLIVVINRYRNIAIA